MPVKFFQENIQYVLKNKNAIKKWIKEVAAQHNASIKDINYIFCSDEYLLDINKKHLQRDYYTDIITFDLSEEEGELSADIFISIERVQENAESSGTPFTQELRRVIIHGILHLLGFNDQSAAEKDIMRKKEEESLSLYRN